MTRPAPICRCLACGLMFLEEFPDHAARSQAYQESYYEEGSGQRFMGVLERAIQLFRRARTRDILKRLPRALSSRPDAMLDVGCGRGMLLSCFARRGWRVTGTQLSATAARAARERYGVDVRTAELPDLALETGSYRVVALYHVLEHLAQPRRYLEEAHRVLRDDGLCVVEVPDGAAAGFALLGGRDFCVDYPNHLFFFTPATLRRMLEQAGFTVQATGHFSLEYSPYSTLQNMLNSLPGAPNRLYRALMRTDEARSLRRDPLTWLHAVLAAALAGPAALMALTSCILPTGNTLRMYCTKGTAVRSAPGVPLRESVQA